jgi:hypothetical protein
MVAARARAHRKRLGKAGHGRARTDTSRGTPSGSEHSALPRRMYNLRKHQLRHGPLPVGYMVEVVIEGRVVAQVDTRQSAADSPASSDSAPANDEDLTGPTMKGAMSPWVQVMIACCGLLSCVIRGAEVKVYQTANEMPQACILVADLPYVRDGRLGKLGYKGTRDRAVQKLQKFASREGANALVLYNTDYPEEIGVHQRGSIVTVFGRAYFCGTP